MIVFRPPDSQLSILQLEVTNACPFNCPQCYKSDLSYKHMPLEQVFQLINEAHALGVKIIVLNGGEPLLHPNISEILRYLDELKIEHNLFTSGFGLDAESITSILSSEYLHLYISLNGSNKRIHSYSRDGWEESYNTAKLLGKLQREFAISWVARSDNVYDLPSLVETCRSHNIPYIAVIANKKLPDGSVQSPLSCEEFKFLVNYIKTQEVGLPEIFVEKCYTDLILAIYGKPSYCFAGRTGCAVSVDGKFMPCIHQDFPQIHCSISDYLRSNSTSINSAKLCNSCAFGVCNRCSALDDICYASEV